LLSDKHFQQPVLHTFVSFKGKSSNDHRRSPDIVTRFSQFSQVVHSIKAGNNWLVKSMGILELLQVGNVQVLFRFTAVAFQNMRSIFCDGNGFAAS